MSPLAEATLEWSVRLHETTGHDPERIVLPAIAYEALHRELSAEPRVADGDPITGVGDDGRLWLACIELVADRG